MDIVTFALAKNKANEYTDAKLGSIAGDFNYLGSVATMEDLPSSAAVGDEYTVGAQGPYVYNGSEWVPATTKGDKGDPGRDGKDAIAYREIKRVKEYLYEVYYDSCDYDFAKEYFKESHSDVNIGACSSFRKGNFYCRNFDWTYDNSAEFVIRTPHHNNKNATIGVAGGISQLTDDFVKSRAYSELYKVLPFYLLDGVNEKGVFVNVNVVPIMGNPMTHTTPTDDVLEELPITMLPRYILDYFSTADEAIEMTTKYIKLYANTALQEMGYEVHYMIGDATKTYALEIVDNEIKVTEINYLTNFDVYDVNFNEDGTVYTPRDIEGGHLPTRDNNIYKFGAGLERFNLIVENYQNLQTKQDMRNLLNDLFYTKTYLSCIHGVSDPFWFTEYVGNVNGMEYTVDTLPQQFEGLIQYFDEFYINRDRNDEVKTWQSVHSSLYDLENHSLYIVTQEDGEELEYPFDFFNISNNYEDLVNLPFINDIKLLGNKSLSDLGVQPEGDYIEDPRYTHTDNNFTTEEKNKLNDIGSLSNEDIDDIVSL